MSVIVWARCVLLVTKCSIVNFFFELGIVFTVKKKRCTFCISLLNMLIKSIYQSYDMFVALRLWNFFLVNFSISMMSLVNCNKFSFSICTCDSCGKPAAFFTITLNYSSFSVQLFSVQNLSSLPIPISLSCFVISFLLYFALTPSTCLNYVSFLSM